MGESSSSAFEDFKHLFSTDDRELGAQAADQFEVEEANMRRARRADAETAEATKFVQEYRAWLQAEIDGHDPDPDKGLEAAAARSFMQTAYRRCVRRLDEQLRIAKE